MLRPLKKRFCGLGSKVQFYHEVAEQESDIRKTFESSKKKQGSKSGADKPNSKKKEGDHPKKWKAPKQREKKDDKFKGHTWYWCGKDTGGKCEKWRAHKPKECKGLGVDAPADKQKRDLTGSDKKKSIEKKLKVAKAYIAKMEQLVEKDATEDKDSE